MQTKRDVTTLLVNDLVTAYEAKNAEHGNAYGARIRKAGLLVLEGKVQKVEENHYLVESGDTKGVVYKVNGNCTCPDYDRAPAHWCKHRIAARFQHSVNLHFTKLAASGHQPHEHGYGCGNHNPPPIECWQVDCPDGPLITCPICEKAQPSPLSTVNTTTGEITDTPFPEEETPRMMTSIGETLKKVITFSPLTGETPEPEPCGEQHPGMTCEEYERGPLSTEQYEPAPVLAHRAEPLPEAPVSLNIKLRVDNHEIQYTMRGHEDAAVLERLPAVLATLERIMHTEVDYERNFIQRLVYAFFPRPSKYSAK